MQNAKSTLVLAFLAASVLAACSSVTTPSSSGNNNGTGGGGGSGGNGGGPVVCAWTQKTSDATCPAGACPILLDEELACDDLYFAAPGLRVAAAPDATWLATSSENDRQVYRLANGVEERQEGILEDLTRQSILLAQAADGSIQLAADTTTAMGTGAGVEYPGGVTHLAYANGSWTSSTVFDRPDKYTPIVDFEVGSAGEPYLWIVGDAPNSRTLATSDGKGGWTLTPQPLWGRYSLAGDGSPIAITFVNGANDTYQLHALVAGNDIPIGSPVAGIGFGTPRLALAAPPPPSPSGLLFGAALATPEGIHVVLASAGAPAKEALVAGITEPVGSCVTPQDNASCTGTCHNTGAGMETNAFALAWTEDGTAWLVYVSTEVDQTIGYSLQGDPGAEFCVGNVLEDKSKGTLHLLRVPLDGSAPSEVLTMPIARPGGGDVFSDWYSENRFVDVRGFGKDLAIGVLTGWIGGPNAVRLLRVDTSKL